MHSVVSGRGGQHVLALGEVNGFAVVGGFLITGCVVFHQLCRPEDKETSVPLLESEREGKRGWVGGGWVGGGGGGGGGGGEKEC